MPGNKWCGATSSDVVAILTFSVFVSGFTCFILPLRSSHLAMFHLCFVNVITGTDMARACFAMIYDCQGSIPFTASMPYNVAKISSAFYESKWLCSFRYCTQSQLSKLFGELVRHLLVCSDSFSIPLAVLVENKDKNRMNSRLASPFHFRYRHHGSRQCTHGIYLPCLGVHQL